MREDFISTEESTSQKYTRLVLNNPNRDKADSNTKNKISERLAKKDLKELHDLVKNIEDSR